jgi:hypothetical protein
MIWHMSAGVACASSALHDDGSPLVYAFTRTSDGWRNDTAPELIVGPHLRCFAVLDAAKAWAERNERAANPCLAANAEAADQGERGEG